jgi:hypothetical protein
MSLDCPFNITCKPWLCCFNDLEAAIINFEKRLQWHYATKEMKQAIGNAIAAFDQCVDSQDFDRLYVEYERAILLASIWPSDLTHLKEAFDRIKESSDCARNIVRQECSDEDLPFYCIRKRTPLPPG